MESTIQSTLVLSRRVNQTVVLDAGTSREMRVTVGRIDPRGQVRLVFKGSRCVRIDREENLGRAS